MAYATTDDLKVYLYLDTAPDGSERLLERASELIELLMYDNYDSTKVNHVEAAKKATCAQVEYWLESGEGINVTGPLRGYKSGDLSMQFGGKDGATSGAGHLAARASIHLNKEGLLYRGVKSGCDYPTQCF